MSGFPLLSILNTTENGKTDVLQIRVLSPIKPFFAYSWAPGIGPPCSSHMRTAPSSKPQPSGTLARNDLLAANPPKQKRI